MLVSKKIVILQPEINRGTVQFRRPQFGDDLFGESQPIGFFFLCPDCCDAILNFFTRLLYADSHFYCSDANQIIFLYTCDIISSRAFSSSLLLPCGMFMILFWFLLPAKVQYLNCEINSKFCINLLKNNILINFTFHSESGQKWVKSCKKCVVNVFGLCKSCRGGNVEFRNFFALMLRQGGNSVLAVA